MSDPRFLYVATWLGTREGGAFEAPSVIVCELDGQGQIRRVDQYGLDQLDEARAYLDAAGTRAAHGTLAAGPDTATADPLRIPPNAATRASDRNREALAARDWAALEGLYAPTMLFDDRRRMVRTTGGRDMLLANARLIARSQVSRTVLATAGDRLALLRYLWTGRREGGPFEVENLEIESLVIIEVDAEGRIVAIIIFDADDRRAAAIELRERFARSDAARWMPAASFEFARALRDRDLVRVRTIVPGDFVFHDHRRAGAGRIEGADGYIAFLAALFELSPDATLEPLYYVAAEKHGHLAVAHWSGTLAEGGEFESVFVQLVRYPDGRPLSAELFELEDLDAARARFEELCGRSA
jgi:hypothetical protein